MTPSELVVAIASESDSFDREVYRRLLERSLARTVQAMDTDVVFRGRTTVRTLAGAFLERAYDRGVRHALFAIDNDGGLKRRPERDDAHDHAAQMASPNDACSVCLLETSLPPSWAARGGLHCLVSTELSAFRAPDSRMVGDPRHPGVSLALDHAPIGGKVGSQARKVAGGGKPDSSRRGTLERHGDAARTLDAGDFRRPERL